MQVKPSFTFSFSKRNQDIFNEISEKYADNENLFITDYFCNAARFYEENKEKSFLLDNGLSKEGIEKIIVDTLKDNDSKLSLLLSSIISDKISSVIAAKVISESNEPPVILNKQELKENVISTSGAKAKKISDSDFLSD